MIRFLIVVVLAIGATIVGISLYLQPNDLSKCGDSPVVSGDCRSVDAIVAVSGGDTNARTDEAIRLYKLGWGTTLIFAGAAHDKLGPSNAAAMKTRALAAGVPDASISIDETSETTRENAINSHNIFTNQDIQSIILVTSGYHQRRANLEFDKQSPDVRIINHPVANDQDWSTWWWTNPRGWTLATGELIRILMFHAGIES
jgi:uncharacterized SAM-binding protein YcdF (DUF218 family)